MRQKIEWSKRKNIIKEIFSVSLPITASAAVMSVTNIVDLGFMMRRLSDIGYSQIEASALYGNYTTMAVPMFNLILAIASPVSMVFLPTFSRAHITGDTGLIRSSTSNAILLSNFIAVPIAIGVSLFSTQVLGLLFGDMNIELGASLTCALVPAILFMIPLQIANTVLESHGEVYAPVVSMAVGSIFKLVLGFVLIGNEQIGVFGAPISTLISYAVSLAVSLIMLKRKCRIGLGSPIGFALPLINSSIVLMPMKIIYMSLCNTFSEAIIFPVVVAISVVLYLMMSVFTGIITPKRLEEMATYTK